MALPRKVITSSTAPSPLLYLILSLYSLLFLPKHHHTSFSPTSFPHKTTQNPTFLPLFLPSYPQNTPHIPSDLTPFSPPMAENCNTQIPKMSSDHQSNELRAAWGVNCPGMDPNLEGLICQGHVFSKVGLSADKVGANISQWKDLGMRLSKFLGFGSCEMSDAEKKRVFHYYLPVFFWCKEQLVQHRLQFPKEGPVPALVVGLSAPQGCGKTTLVDALEYLLNSTGSRAASVSIDDFYLTAADQEKLALEHAGNRLLEFRGNAGTHDLQLGTQTLKSLRNLTSSGAKAKIPHYEKILILSSHHGHGDRANPSTWREVEGPLEVLLFEGWMLGFEPQEEDLLVSIDPQLVEVNKNLKAYDDLWFSLVDSWIIIEVEDPHWVFMWRLQAEIKMREEGRPGMTDEEVADFVLRYMPAYKAYLPTLYSRGPSNARPQHILKFKIDKDRTPID